MPPSTTIRIFNFPRQLNVKRLGMNLGAHIERTGSYLLKNVIRNPGFEAGEYGMIFFVRVGATATRVQADWNSPTCGESAIRPAQQADFWLGAEYEIVDGAALGRTGTITDFTLEDPLDGSLPGGHYTFFLDGDGPAPAEGDAIFVRQQVPGYSGGANPSDLHEVLDITRPGSPGAQSLRLIPGNQASWRYEVDSTPDSSSGKLLIADGDWHFEIWARAEIPGAGLTVRFLRDGAPAFLSQTFPLTTEWQHIEHDFTVPAGSDPAGAGANPPTLALTLRPTGGGSVLVDDVWLSRNDQTNEANNTAFTDKLVARLQELQPGILRNWHTRRLGSTLDNQLADPWARRTHNYQPGSDVASSYHYSIHEFLELAEQIGAEPWYVIPPTFSQDDLENLVAYLAAEPGAHPYAGIRENLGHAVPWTTVFNTIHLEYGNEMWGGACEADPFAGASLRGGERLGRVASRRFEMIRNSPFFTEDKFNLIIGSRYREPATTEQIESQSNQHDMIALAPYFGTVLEETTFFDDEQRFYSLFARSQRDVQPTGRVGLAQGHLTAAGQGTRLAIYEINFHTTGGDIPIQVRNDFVTSLGGGLALPLFMLTYLRNRGIRNQAAWLAATFSNPVDGRPNEFVRLFGTLRDLEATGRKRSTGLGVELANRAIRGNLLITSYLSGPPIHVQQPINELDVPIELPLIHVFAFRAGHTYAAMLFNLDLMESHAVTLRIPTRPHSTATLHTLTGDTISSNNEVTEQVSIVTTSITDFRRPYHLTLPPHSACVLHWRTATTPPTLEPPPPITSGADVQRRRVRRS